MKCNSVSTNISPRKSGKLNAAKRGAIITAGVLGTSTGISWLTKPDEMRKVVSDYGGKNSYIKNFVLGLALLSAGGAVLNTVMNAVAEKIHYKKPPKAVN